MANFGKYLNRLPPDADPRLARALSDVFRDLTADRMPAEAKLDKIVMVTDYGAKGDGVTDDTAAITSAISAAAGMALLFPAGTYIVGSTISIAGTGIVFLGEGPGSVLKLAASVNAPLLSFDAATNIRVRNLGFDGNGANQSSTSTRIIRIQNGAADLYFEGCYFKNSYHDNVFINANTNPCNRIFFTNCEFNGTQTSTSASVRATDCNDLNFIGCYFTDWGADAIALSWFQATDGGLIVAGCTFKNTDATLFAIETVASGTVDEYRAKNVTIVGNVFDGNDNATGGSGISGIMDNATISSNVWRNSGSANWRCGIEASGQNWTIQNNNLDNGTIVFSTLADAISKNATIVGNVIRNQGANRWGIQFGSTSTFELQNIVVTANVIDIDGVSGTSGGIYAGTYSGAAIVVGCRIDGNIIFNGSDAGTGIRVAMDSGSEDISICNNTVYDCSTGIRLDDTLTNSTVRGNHTASCPTAFLNNTTTGTHRIYDNNFGATQELVSSDRGNAAATLINGQDAQTQVWATALTADRAVTLSSTYAYRGAKFRIVRTAASTGAFNLNVGTGPLKALTAGQWCEVEHDGTAWFLSAFGSL